MSGKRKNAAERMAEIVGSPAMLWGTNLIVAAWMLWNALGPAPDRFDPWPFIALNLVLSWQAANATPILQMASNRTEERDRALAEKIDREIREVRAIVKRIADREGSEL